MKKYWLYFKYIIEHKRNVFLECRKVKGMWWHGITHDLSKFSPSEFFPYARKFYGNYPPKALLKDIGYKNIKTKESIEEEFQKAWEHHYKNNPHHWNYWIGKDMDCKDIDKMICDWKAMGRKFGDTAQEFYLKNYKKMDLTFYTRMYIELALDLNLSEAHGYGHTMEQFSEMYDKETYDNYFGWIKEKYKIDTYEILKHTEADNEN